MKTKISILLFVLSLPMVASPVIQFDPVDGAVSGASGSTVGWGFSVESSPTQWISFAGSFLMNETNAALGVYTDLIGSSGGPVDFTLPTAAPAWIQVFDAALQTGVGAYGLSPTALPGDENSGVLRVLWAAYTADPYSCGSCFAGSFYEDFAFRVTVATASQAAPEPGTLFMMLVAGGALLGRGVRASKE